MCFVAICGSFGLQGHFLSVNWKHFPKAAQTAFQLNCLLHCKRKDCNQVIAVSWKVLQMLYPVWPGWLGIFHRQETQLWQVTYPRCVSQSGSCNSRGVSDSVHCIADCRSLFIGICLNRNWPSSEVFSNPPSQSLPLLCYAACLIGTLPDGKDSHVVFVCSD